MGEVIFGDATFRRAYGTIRVPVAPVWESTGSALPKLLPDERFLGLGPVEFPPSLVFMRAKNWLLR